MIMLGFIVLNCFMVILEIKVDIGNQSVPLPVRRINQNKFKQIAIGMTKQEVKESCGEPGYVYTKTKDSSKLIGWKSGNGLVQVYCVSMVIDMWEYNWTYKAAGCCRFSYAFFFDKNGKLIEKKSPEKKLGYCYWLYRSIWLSV